MVPIDDKIVGLGERAKRRFPPLAVAGRYIRLRKKRIIALFVMVAHIAGALTSVQAIMSTRTSQGAIAWAVSLNTLPYFAVPAYWAFGRTKFDGYVQKRRTDYERASPLIEGFIQKANEDGLTAPGHGNRNQLLEHLTRLPATTGNDVELLRNGDAIFPSIFEGIDAAQSYILIQFYIVRDDDLGERFQQHLLAAVSRGVKVQFIYDEIGSYRLPNAYVAGLREGGAEMVPFNSMKGIANRFQINFRNHRKMVVVDGRTAWVGGVNIGDEYWDGHDTRTPWHDTMVKVTGPVVQAIQVSFWEDWLWATDRLLELNWDPEPAPSGADMTVLCLPSGPADQFETCALYFLHLLNSATQRVWIASPYFVPDEQIVSALKLAALRGVDVRILLPDVTDSWTLDLSGWSFVGRLENAGVKFHRHTNGFMHQKAILVDSDLATVGSANFDNRSFRLNFEITIEVRDETFAAGMAAMFEKDFAHSRMATYQDLRDKGFLFRFAVRVSSLFAPIQ